MARKTLWTKSDISALPEFPLSKEPLVIATRKEPPSTLARKAPPRTDEERQASRDSLVWQTLYPEYHQEKIEITPEMAAVGLGRATQNRRVSEPRVNELATIITDGEWNFDGSPIRFDCEGGMFDGKHRLLACVKANKPILSCVVYGLPVEAIKTVDTNRVRTAGDQLAILGVHYSYQTAAAARWLIAIKQGKFSKQRLANEVTKLAVKHQAMSESVALCYQAMGVAPSLISAIHYATAHLVGQSEQADRFAEAFVSGVSSMENCPAIAWREHILRQRLVRQRLTKEYQLYGTIYAWNKFCKGEPILRMNVLAKAVINDLDVGLI